MFPGTILHQRHELAQNKTHREDNRDQNGSIFCDIDHILNFKGPMQMPLKSSTQSSLNFAALFFHEQTLVLHGGEHGNADMLWVVNV